MPVIISYIYNKADYQKQCFKVKERIYIEKER